MLSISQGDANIDRSNNIATLTYIKLIMILIVRPYEQAIITQKKLYDLGIESIVSPIIEVEFLPKAQECLNYLNNFDYVLITSYNTVKFINSNHDLQLALQDKKLLVVGEKSAMLLPNVIAYASTIHELFNKLSFAKQEKILYISGDPISFNIEDAPFIIKRVICYKTVPIKQNNVDFAEKVKNATGICLYSANTAKIFKNLCEESKISIVDKNIFCISNKVAEIIDGLSKNILIAREPNERSIIMLIKNYFL